MWLLAVGNCMHPELAEFLHEVAGDEQLYNSYLGQSLTKRSVIICKHRTVLHYIAHWLKRLPSAFCLLPSAFYPLHSAAVCLLFASQATSSLESRTQSCCEGCKKSAT